MNGVWTVIPTIFDENDIILYNEIDFLIDRQIKAGITGIVLLGTTSETSTIDDSDKLIIVNTIWTKYNDKIKIMVGVGGNNTKEVNNFIHKIKNFCHYIMLTVPYYNKPNQEGLQDHMIYLANQHKDKEMIIYNIPGRCGINLDVITLCNILKESLNIIGIKEASGNIAQIYDTIQRTNISVLSGDDSLIIPIMSLGGTGVISVVSNIIPEKMMNIYQLCAQNDFKSALVEYNRIHIICHTCFITSNPIPLKIILKKMNLISSDKVVLPLKIPTNDQKLNDQISNLIKLIPI
jgi:4-hydroxy-tetrahydrodipicolinate synthase